MAQCPSISADLVAANSAKALASLPPLSPTSSAPSSARKWSGGTNSIGSRHSSGAQTTRSPTRRPHTSPFQTASVATGASGTTGSAAASSNSMNGASVPASPRITSPRSDDRCATLAVQSCCGRQQTNKQLLTLIVCYCCCNKQNHAHHQRATRRSGALGLFCGASECGDGSCLASLGTISLADLRCGNSLLCENLRRRK